MKTYREFIAEVGDWWHPDPEKDKLMLGRGPKLRARQDREPKPDYSNKLKPGETYMQFAKRKARGESVEYVDELFVTKKSSEDQKKKKVAELIRLMKAADDPLSDAPARRKKINANEEYIDETSLSRVVSKVKKGGIATVSAERGDKSKSENKARSKQLEKDIRGRGMGMTKAKGSFVEVDDEGKRREVGERSYVVTPGKKGKRKFKKAVAALGKKHDQDSVLIKQKPGLKSKASWLGTTKRKDAEPKQGKTSPQGTLSTSNSNKPLPTGEGGTKVKNRTYQFK
jgi:hypothetical protein